MRAHVMIQHGVTLMLGAGLVLAGCKNHSAPKTTSQEAATNTQLTDTRRDGRGVGQGQPHRPPEMFTVCEGKASGDACTLMAGSASRPGTCVSTPQGKLACRPAPPQELISACSGKANGVACSATMNGRTLQGTCKTPPGMTTILCLPGPGPRAAGPAPAPPPAAPPQPK